MSQTLLPAAPSIHIRALITWLAIFPLVTLGSIVVESFSTGWPLYARTALLTALVVPLAVYAVVPLLLRLRGRMMRSRMR